MFSDPFLIQVALLTDSVDRLYDIKTGGRMFHVADLVNGGCYTAAWRERYKKLPYPLPIDESQTCSIRFVIT
jgi:hypothetical protein